MPTIMEDQDDLIVRKPECDEVGSELNAKAALEDVLPPFGKDCRRDRLLEKYEELLSLR